MSLFLYREYIFGGRLFLFEDFGSDSVRVSLPTYIYFFDWFKNGMPLWSDKMGIGTNVLSHGDIVFDPFTYLLFLFGRNNIIYMFVYMVIAKIILAGVFFWMFLGKYKLSSYAKLIGAMTYAFSGYMLIVGQNYVFGTIYVYIPLILLGFEIWLQTKKSWLLITMLTATILYFFYFFYMIAIFLGIYAIFRYFTIYNFKLKHFLTYIVSLTKYGLFSLGLSAFFWLPFLTLTLNNLRVGSSILSFEKLFFPELKVIITAIGRLFGYDIFGAPKIYLGFNADYFQLALFSGVITLILIPQIFCEKDKKKRLAYAIFSTTLASLLFIPFFTYVFNGFSDFTYRWTFILHSMLALFLSIAVNQIFGKLLVNYKLLFITIGGLFISSLIVIFTLGLMTIYPEFNFRTNIEASQGMTALSKLDISAQIFKDSLLNGFRMFVKDYMLITAYLLLIVLFFRTKYKSIIKIILLLLVFFELIWFPAPFVNNRLSTSPNPIENKLGYFDNTTKAINYLKDLDKSIYRIDKSYDSVVSEYGNTPSNNDAMVQGYRGLKNYSANNQPNYIRFLQSAGIFVKYPARDWVMPVGTKPEDFKDSNLNYINGVGNRYLLQSFLGVKYYLTNNDNKTIIPSYYHYLATIDDVKIYKNNYYLPIGFTFENYITNDQFIKLSNSDKDKALLSFAVIEDNVSLTDINRASVKKIKDITSEKNIRKIILDRKSENLNISSYEEDYIYGEIKVAKNKLLVLTIPYDEGWKIYVDDQRIIPIRVDNGLIGIKLESDKHMIELRYFPPNMIVGIIISIITMLFGIFIIRNKIIKNTIIVIRRLKQFYDINTQKTYAELKINTVMVRSGIIQKLKVNIKKSIFYICTLFGILSFLLSGFISRGYSFYYLFVPDKTNYFMDFFNPLSELLDGPYTRGSIYPPLPLLLYKILLRYVPYDIVEKGAIAIRAIQAGQIVFLFYTLLTLLTFFILIMEVKKGSRIEKYIFSVVILFSAPFLFQFERANIIFVALLFSMLFVFFKDSKNRFVREFALISLAISAGIKIYPAIFGLLLIKQKRFKDAFRTLTYGLALFILPFFALGGIGQLPILIKNIFSASDVVTRWGVGYMVNVQNIVRILFGFFGDFSSNPIPIGNTVSIVVLILGIISSLYLRSKWKTVALITTLMILVPSISYEYVLIFMIIPLIMFLDREEKEKRIEYIYLFCFILMLIPFTLGRVTIINNGFGGNPVLPLTYGILIQNIAISIMAIGLITQGLNNIPDPMKFLRTGKKYLFTFLIRTYGTKSMGFKGYAFIVGKIFLTFLILLLLFGYGVFSTIHWHFKKIPESNLYAIELKTKDYPYITSIEPYYVHYGDNVMVSGGNFQISENASAVRSRIGPIKRNIKLKSNYGEIDTASASDEKFIFPVPLNWKVGKVKIWVEATPNKNYNEYRLSNIVEITVLDRLGDFNNDDIKYFGQIKYLDSQTQDINEFQNFKLRNYRFSRWIPTKAFQVYADLVELTR